jgi:hypothetical protein
MSGLPPLATELRTSLVVRFVPQADSCTAAKQKLFDNLVGLISILGVGGLIQAIRT